MTGRLVLIPVTLGGETLSDVLPHTISRRLFEIDHYIVENEKTARRFIKSAVPEKPQSTLKISTLDKHAATEDYQAMLYPCIDGKDIGLMSEAGCPGIADPGANVVRAAHEMNIPVVPLVGPSSILLALMASGMNGQNFAFTGYLPIDGQQRKSAIKNLEKLSFDKQQSQIFIETPYRNNRLLEDLIQTLHPETRLCVAASLTCPDEFIKSMKAGMWKKTKTELQNRPAIFIIQKDR